MRNYTVDEVREIAQEAGGEAIARFESYIELGLFNKVTKPVGKFKPFLAVKASLAQVKSFPVIATPKYDGVRGILHEVYGLISRASKPIPNIYIKEILENLKVYGLDGEILTYTNGKVDGFNVTQSKVMTEDGRPDFKFMVFDDFSDPEKTYLVRLEIAKNKIKQIDSPFVELTELRSIHTATELKIYEEKCAAMSEGLIVRNNDMSYKFGKSTVKEGGLLKIKRFMDDEGIIVEVNKILNGLNAVGSFTILWKGKLFNLGNGWSDVEAMEMWRNRHELMNAKVTFKYQEIGANGAPRFSSFLGIRKDI